MDKTKKMKSPKTPNALDLCFEILVQIFLCLPLSSLYNASLVCKEWKNTICDRKFLEAYHLNVGLALLFQEQTLRPRDTDPPEVKESLHSEKASSSVPEERVRLYDTHLVTMKEGLVSKTQCARVRISGKIVGSCNEMALIKPDDEKLDFFLFNLATQEILELPQSRLPEKKQNLHQYSLGFDNRTKAYKVLSFLCVFESLALKINVLSQGSTRWRPITEPLAELICPDKSVSSNGFLHWLGAQFEVYDSKIISMDMDSEVFYETSMPENHSSSIYPCSLDLLQIEGCLALIQYENRCTLQLKIWILRDISEGAWERKFWVTLETLKHDPGLSLYGTYYIGHLYNGKFLLFKQQREDEVNYFVMDVVKQELEVVVNEMPVLPRRPRFLSMSPGSPC